MDDIRRQRLIGVGIDLEDALNRFMGNEDLIIHFLCKFSDDMNYKSLVEAFEANDAKAALAASHALKGVSGNLSMTRLYELLTAQVNALRNDNFDAAKAMMDDITAVYNEINAAIND